tara:strand:- start:1624 stop:1761 length:138 start_codon:yes stop_codon:yes gene_type:complete
VKAWACTGDKNGARRFGVRVAYAVRVYRRFALGTADVENCAQNEA